MGFLLASKWYMDDVPCPENGMLFKLKEKQMQATIWINMPIKSNKSQKVINSDFIKYSEKANLSWDSVNIPGNEGRED